MRKKIIRKKVDDISKKILCVKTRSKGEIISSKVG